MLHVRSIAVSAAVLCFFALGIVGSIGGLAPDVCCKRAMLGSVVAYIAAVIGVRIINAILTHAMISSQINKDRELLGDSQDAKHL